ncbi:MAG: CoA-binding protein [Burkholderiaceae bacterium]|nr:CoA-binding protein [Burkholderiaceae bacterium]
MKRQLRLPFCFSEKDVGEAEVVRRVLESWRVIAVVGLSNNPGRDSYGVARYMQHHGYRIVPVNPNHAGETILGETCHASLQDAADALQLEGKRIEIVDCFRRAEAIVPIAEAAIAVGARCLWMQLGIVNQAAADQARAAGLEVVMDRCIKVDHAYL